MEQSRKRVSSERDIGESNKRKTRKTRKSKKLEVADVVDENNVDLNVGQENGHRSNNSPVIASNCVGSFKDPYSEEDDINIINYFRKNMHMLSLKDEASTYYILKAKYLQQRSAKSIQTRFVTHILPNLFRYNIMNSSDIIDFYDASKLEVPAEFINFVAESEAARNNTTPAENIQPLDKNNENDLAPPSASTQSDNRIEIVPSTSEEKCLKTILNYIQFNNSNETSVFVPDTEPNIRTVENRLFSEFGIRKESVKVIPKTRFETIVQLKNTLDLYDNLVYDVLKNRINDTKFIERMLPDARKLFEYLSPFMDKSKRPLQRISPEVSANIGSQIVLSEAQGAPSLERQQENSEVSGWNGSWSEIELGNVGQIISTLSDSLDHVTISSSSANQPKQPNVEMTNKVEEENIVCSPYFKDHTYCQPPISIPTSTSQPPSPSPSAANNPMDSVEASARNDTMDIELSSLIDHACIPQIQFSKRFREKILNENINVGHLITSTSNNCDEHNSNSNINKQIE